MQLGRQLGDEVVDLAGGDAHREQIEDGVGGPPGLLAVTPGHRRDADYRVVAPLSRTAPPVGSAQERLIVLGSPKAGAGIVASKLATTKRKDGQAEVAYNGHPLYFYAGDQQPGDTTGEGLDQFGAPWDVVATTGKGIDND